MTTTLPNQIAALRAKAEQLKHLERLNQNAAQALEDAKAARVQELEDGRKAAAERREALLRERVLAAWLAAGGSEADFASRWPALRERALERQALAELERSEVHANPL